MKHLICTILAVLFCSLASAASLNVVSGDVAVLKEDATCTFELDLTNAMFERKKDFKEWCGLEYEERVLLMETAFPESFNAKTKGLKISTDGSSAKYKMTLHISNFVRKAGAFYGASAWMRIDGTLTVIETSTGNEVLKIDINHFYGEQDFVETDRFPKAVSELAKKLHKLKKK